jgi:hypothetical protein
MADIIVRNEGSLFLLCPETRRGDVWLNQHVADGAQFWCRSLVVEPRYVADIVHGAIVDGLEVR